MAWGAQDVEMGVTTPTLQTRNLSQCNIVPHLQTPLDLLTVGDSAERAGLRWASPGPCHSLRDPEDGIPPPPQPRGDHEDQGRC